MIVVIRISGLVNRTEEVENAFYRLRLRRKFSCVVIPETKENVGKIMKLRNFIAYGKIDNETLKLLIEKRGKSLNNKKIDADKIANEIINNKTGKNLKELGIKPFFRLHPPIGGVKSSKMYYPKGILGNHNEKINDLIRRML